MAAAHPSYPELIGTSGQHTFISFRVTDIKTFPTILLIIFTTQIVGRPGFLFGGIDLSPSINVLPCRTGTSFCYLRSAARSIYFKDKVHMQRP